MADVLQDLLSQFVMSVSYRRDFETRAEQLYQLYISWTKPRDDGRSNLFIPKTYAALAALRARMMGMCVGAKPWCEMLEVGSDDKLKAHIAASHIEHQSQVTGFRPQFRRWLTNLLVYPASVGYVGWRYETRKRRLKRSITLPGGLAVHIDTTVDQVMVDDNEFRAVDFWDFWNDPAAGTIDDARFCWHREWATRKQIEEYLEVLKMADQGRVHRIDWENAGQNIPLDTRHGPSRRAQSVGKPSVASITGTGNEPEAQMLHEILHYWEDGRHAVIINRTSLAYDGKNPYDHGKKPFVATSYEPLEGEFYGLSLVHLAEHLQHELNTMRNQRIDNVAHVLNRGWKRKNPNITDEELVSRPGMIIDVDQLDDIDPLITPDVTASAYQEENITERNIDEVLGSPAQFRGAATSKRETATELSMLSEGAGTRVEDVVAMIEENVLKRVALLYDMNNKQFIDQARTIRLFGQEGTSWATIDPEDLQRQFDYVPASAATDAAANKSLRRQQLTQAAQVFGGNQLLAQTINWPAFAKVILENFDIKNLDEIVMSQPAAPAIPGVPGAGLPPQMAALLGAQAGQAGPPPASPINAPPGVNLQTGMMQGMLGLGGSAGQPA
jgi:hypothetical protein